MENALNARNVVYAALLAAVVVGIKRVVSGKYGGKEVVRVEDRHNLPREPVKHRYVELGVAEKEFVRHDHANHGGQKCFFFTRVRGPRVTLKQLERAAECLQRKHPFFRCRITRVNGHFVLEELADLKLRINIRPRKHENSFREGYYSEFGKVPLEVGDTAGSPHAIWLYQSEQPDPSGIETCDIGIEVSHYAMDSSLAHLVHDSLLYALDEEAPLPEYGQWPISIEVGLRQVILKQISKLSMYLGQARLFFRVVHNALTSPAVNIRDRTDIPAKDLGYLNKPLCLHEALSEKESNDFLAKCRASGISVTGAVTAAFIEAICELCNKKTSDSFSPFISVVADARAMCEPPISANQSAVYVYSLPAFKPKARFWEESRDASRTVSLAKEFKAFLADQRAQKMDTLLYAELIGFWLATQPVDRLPPLLNISSWCAGAPVTKTYGKDDKYVVEDVELLQNMAFHIWPDISLYTFLGRIHISLCTGVPTFKEEDITLAFNRSIGYIRRFINS